MNSTKQNYFTRAVAKKDTLAQTKEGFKVIAKGEVLVANMNTVYNQSEALVLGRYRLIARDFTVQHINMAE
jgi:hypothetical protein